MIRTGLKVFQATTTDRSMPKGNRHYIVTTHYVCPAHVGTRLYLCFYVLVCVFLYIFCACVLHCYRLLFPVAESAISCYLASPIWDGGEQSASERIRCPGSEAARSDWIECF